MAKKISDEKCYENYTAMCKLFEKTIPEYSRFSVVYGCGVDVGMTDFVVARRSTYTYSSYAIGFDTQANEIVILPITRELNGHGEPFYLKKSEIKKAKMSWLSKEINIQSPKLPKKYIQFSVQAQINQDPDAVCLCVKQDEQAENFLDFFKHSYAK